MCAYCVGVKPAPLTLAAPGLFDPNKALADCIPDGQSVLFARLAHLPARNGGCELAREADKHARHKKARVQQKVRKLTRHHAAAAREHALFQAGKWERAAQKA